MSLELWTTIFGWMALINGVLLVVSSLAIVTMRGSIVGIHRKMFGALSDADLERAYFRYLATFKIAYIVFNLTPYIALCMVDA